VKYIRQRTGNEGWLTSYADLITNLLIFFILIISASQIQTGKMEKIIQSLSSEEMPESLSSAERQLKQTLTEQNLDRDVTVAMTDEGLELSFNSGVMFDSGRAEILASMNAPLAKVLQVIKPYAEKYHLAVEGHTDERPINSALYKSNWELSSARALEIRQRLDQLGIDKKRIRVEAYADNKPLPQKERDQLDRETQLARHRRVVIRLF